MHTIKMFALVLAMSTAAVLGACSKTERAGMETQTATSAHQGKVNHISNAELQTLLAQGVTLVDIRLPEEWQQTGVVAGSQRLTLFEASGRVATGFLDNLQQIAPPGQPVVLICRTGNRTRAWAEMLAQMGYPEVYNVKLGIMDWLGEGRPVTR